MSKKPKSDPPNPNMPSEDEIKAFTAVATRVMAPALEILERIADAQEARNKLLEPVAHQATAANHRATAAACHDEQEDKIDASWHDAHRQLPAPGQLCETATEAPGNPGHRPRLATLRHTSHAGYQWVQGGGPARFEKVDVNYWRPAPAFTTAQEGGEKESSA